MVMVDAIVWGESTPANRTRRYKGRIRYYHGWRGRRDWWKCCGVQVFARKAD